MDGRGTWMAEGRGWMVGGLGWIAGERDGWQGTGISGSRTRMDCRVAGWTGGVLGY